MPTDEGAQRPRWVLVVQALFWRSLMQIGMFLHKLASPRPSRPNFTRRCQSTIAPHQGTIEMRFWVPKEYKRQRRKGGGARAGGKRFPVVVNFHGGGFTLGEAMDDARWANAVVEDCRAVVVGVEYRRAPEHTFPTAVEDGADAIIWLASHADELTLDPDRIAVSGFSCGGNMSFTVPLRMQQEMLPESAPPSANASSEDVQKAVSAGRTLVRAHQDIAIVAIVAFYPPTDYTSSREERRMTCLRPDRQLPAVFTRLFDESYLQPPTLDRASPYLSPGSAPDRMLAGLPDDVVMFCCEWDMLLAEGERFRDRLVGLGKSVDYHCVPGVPHAWDKAPNPLWVTPGVKEHYAVATRALNRAFWERTSQSSEASYMADDAV